MKLVDEILSGRFTDPQTLWGALFYAGIFTCVAWLVGRAIQGAVHRLLQRDTHGVLDRTAVRFLAQLARIGVYLFALVSYAHLVPALKNLGTAWLASVSVISVIVGLAAQNTLANLIAGVSLLLYRPFKLGDRMQLTGPAGLETGVVEGLNLGYTVLRTDDNRRIVVPNSIMASQTTINLSLGDPRAVCSITFNISYESDLDKARAILTELARRHPKSQEFRGCALSQLGPSGVALTLEVWCADSAVAGDLKAELLEAVKKRFAAEGIEIPYPHTHVILRDDRRRA